MKRGIRCERRSWKIKRGKSCCREGELFKRCSSIIEGTDTEVNSKKGLVKAGDVNRGNW